MATLHLLARSMALAGASTILIAVVCGTVLNVSEGSGPFVDWHTYVAAAQRMTAGLAIYAPAQLAGPYHLTDQFLVGYAYPPASVPFFLPFESYPIGLAAWITVNLGALLTALWRMVSRASPHIERSPIRWSSSR